MTSTYDGTFYDWVNLTARRSALALVPLVKEQLQASSLLDVGCGQGAWLAAWSELGMAEGFGIDGEHVRIDQLRIPAASFLAVDLSKPWNVGRRFDLVQSLEVAEHLPESAAKDFVKCLCAHGDIILFSAATPGQGGEGHVNERVQSYWAELFAAQGYAAFDCVRPLAKPKIEIGPWYRFNTLLYANDAGIVRLSASATASRVDRLRDLDRGGDFRWHLRRAILRALPEPAVTLLSRLRYRLVLLISGKIG